MRDSPIGAPVARLDVIQPDEVHREAGFQIEALSIPRLLRLQPTLLSQISTLQSRT
ncbi:MAG: hypothetical protein V4534_04365 [Myxococcota bacterium]